MAVEKTRLSPGSMKFYAGEYLKNNFIDPETSERLGVEAGPAQPGRYRRAGGADQRVRRGGLRKDGGRSDHAHPGKLIYRGINIEEIVREAYDHDRFVFEEVIWLLLFGSLPTRF